MTKLSPLKLSPINSVYPNHMTIIVAATAPMKYQELLAKGLKLF